MVIQRTKYVKNAISIVKHVMVQMRIIVFHVILIVFFKIKLAFNYYACLMNINFNNNVINAIILALHVQWELNSIVYLV